MSKRTAPATASPRAHERSCFRQTDTTVLLWRLLLVSLGEVMFYKENHHFSSRSSVKPPTAARETVYECDFSDEVLRLQRPNSTWRTSSGIAGHGFLKPKRRPSVHNIPHRTSRKLHKNCNRQSCMYESRFTTQELVVLRGVCLLRE